MMSRHLRSYYLLVIQKGKNTHLLCRQDRFKNLGAFTVPSYPQQSCLSLLTSHVAFAALQDPPSSPRASLQQDSSPDFLLGQKQWRLSLVQLLRSSQKQPRTREVLQKAQLLLRCKARSARRRYTHCHLLVVLTSVDIRPRTLSKQPRKSALRCRTSLTRSLPRYFYNLSQW